MIINNITDGQFNTLDRWNISRNNKIYTLVHVDCISRADFYTSTSSKIRCTMTTWDTFSFLNCHKLPYTSCRFFVKKSDKIRLKSASTKTIQSLSKSCRVTPKSIQSCPSNHHQLPNHLQTKLGRICLSPHFATKLSFSVNILVL